MTMHKISGILISVLAVCSALGAAQRHDNAYMRQAGASPEQMKQKAEAARGGDRAKLFLELAEQEMEAANHYFTDGNVEKAHDKVKESIADAEKAAEAALTSGKRLKQTEIELRKLQKRTEDIRHSLNFEDRPALETVEKRLEELRRSLLHKMFGDSKTRP
jgi:hypothetical protein